MDTNGKRVWSLSSVHPDSTGKLTQRAAQPEIDVGRANPLGMGNPMKFSLALLLTMIAGALPAATAFGAPSIQSERIGAAYVLAFGRAPTLQEIADGEKQGDLGVSDLLARLQSRLQSDASLQRAVVLKAGVDAFGRSPTKSEMEGASAGVTTYTELMKRHVAWIATHPADYEQILERAYQRVVRRAVYASEIAYWKKYDTLPYVLLVGCIEDWGRRNAPGLMETTGTPTMSVNSRYVTTIALSPNVAAEVRLAAGLPLAGDAAFAAALGHNLVAPGAGNIVTTGHMHLVAAGADDLVLPDVGS